MNVPINRRQFGALLFSAPLPARNQRLPAAFRSLEKKNGGRLGVFVLDTGSRAASGYRAGERFPMCSTFKFLAAAAILARVDRGAETLDRELRIPPQPLLSNSPLTGPNAGGAMTMAALCRAALIRSDNTAANLLLDALGGPAGLTRFARSLGDRVTRLDRVELALNESRAGDPRDTTSPRAIAHDLEKLLLGSALAAPSRRQLTDWMQANETGRDRLRAHLPAGWSAADKTGSNGEHTSNDVAVLWPPGRSPLVVAAYITQCFGPESKRAEMLAEIGRAVIESSG